MTAKEEAQNLINLFIPHANGLRVLNDGEACYNKKNIIESSKECAVIHVDEMIKRLNDICFNYGIDPRGTIHVEFDWLREIKQELERL